MPSLPKKLGWLLLLLFITGCTAQNLPSIETRSSRCEQQVAFLIPQELYLENTGGKYVLAEYTLAGNSWQESPRTITMNNWTDGTRMGGDVRWKHGDEAGENVNYLYPEYLLDHGLSYDKLSVASDGTVLGNNHFLADAVVEKMPGTNVEVNTIGGGKVSYASYRIVDPQIKNCRYFST